MHVILDWLRETASTVRFVPLPSTSSITPTLNSLHWWQSLNWQKFLYFQFLCLYNAATVCLGASRILCYSFKRCIVPVLAFDFAYLPCVSSRPFLCGMRQPSMLGRSRAHGHNIYMQNVGGVVGRFRSDKQKGSCCTNHILILAAASYLWLKRWSHGMVTAHGLKPTMELPNFTDSKASRDILPEESSFTQVHIADKLRTHACWMKMR